jgi:hypothetical protein
MLKFSFVKELSIRFDCVLIMRKQILNLDIDSWY